MSTSMRKGHTFLLSLVCAIAAVVLLMPGSSPAQAAASSPDCTCYGAQNINRIGDQCFIPVQSGFFAPLCTSKKPVKFSKGFDPSHPSQEALKLRNRMIHDVVEISNIKKIFDSGTSVSVGLPAGVSVSASPEALKALLRQPAIEWELTSLKSQVQQLPLSAIRHSDPVVFDSPGYKATDYNIALNIRLPLERAFDLSANQELTVAARVSRWQESMSVGTTPDLTAAGISDLGKTRGNDWSLAGAVDYRVNQYYVTGIGLFNTGHARIADDVLGSDKFNVSGYSLDATLGRLIPLWNISPSYGRGLVTKEPVAVQGWTAVFLDLSGAVTRIHQHAGGFVDGAGFITGEGNLDATFVGLQAKLAARYYWGDYVVVPYVGVGFSRAVSFSNRTFVPAQGDDPESHTFDFSLGRNTTKLEAGFYSIPSDKFRLSANVFHSVSSDEKTTGGKATLTIPIR